MNRTCCNLAESEFCLFKTLLQVGGTQRICWFCIGLVMRGFEWGFGMKPLQINLKFQAWAWKCLVLRVGSTPAIESEKNRLKC